MLRRMTEKEGYEKEMEILQKRIDLIFTDWHIKDKQKAILEAVDEWAKTARYICFHDQPGHNGKGFAIQPRYPRCIECNEEIKGEVIRPGFVRRECHGGIYTSMEWYCPYCQRIVHFAGDVPRRQPTLILEEEDD